jgi:hypothetical protein
MAILTAWLSIGLLRQGLQVVALVSGLILPFAGAPDYTATWDLFFNGVLPAMVPIFLILIGFDVMMCKVLSDDADPKEVARLSTILRCHYWVALPVLIAFGTFIAPALLP